MKHQDKGLCSSRGAVRSLLLLNGLAYMHKHVFRVHIIRPQADFNCIVSQPDQIQSIDGFRLLCGISFESLCDRPQILLSH